MTYCQGFEYLDCLGAWTLVSTLELHEFVVKNATVVFNLQTTYIVALLYNIYTGGVTQ